MKFICQKDDLMQGLSLAAKASAARSPQAVLECVSSRRTLPAFI